ncbi:hypothetical protein [Alteromonas gilva]|uniref:Uncharacterized protein n=1 Tax=Alteromonas gilva TaxID=2987522 RepID=A0ABT5KYK1_9ALTE|nr:hypothetical protein [Alteromonas gilva]MDC8829850.1 hypothetical protein [Alteromonas gilva]
MINTTIRFSDASVDLLRVRKLNEQDISGFADILANAAQQNGSAKDFLQSLSPEELRLVQKANSLANPIEVNALSKEGAQNLLSQPDGSDLVDLNNDGIVEVGAARTIHFPPVNAPASVKAAWEEATADLAPFDKVTLELTMHHMVYGVNLDIPGAVQKTPLPPEQQWNGTNIKRLENYARSNLEFRVNYDGWTPYNQQLKTVYDSFFATIGGGSSAPQPGFTTEQPAVNNAPTVIPSDITDAEGDNTANEADEEAPHPNSLLNEVHQLILAARLGIDRQKIKELEKEMEAVRNDTTLSAEQKAEKLQALQQEIEQLIEKARERAVEEEKRKATQEATTVMQKERLKIT